MPKNLTLAMRAHLDGETTRLAAIWRPDGRVSARFVALAEPAPIIRCGRG